MAAKMCVGETLFRVNRIGHKVWPWLSYRYIVIWREVYNNDNDNNIFNSTMEKHI
jgi:hypothetical protein